MDRTTPRPAGAGPLRTSAPFALAAALGALLAFAAGRLAADRGRTPLTPPVPPPRAAAWPAPATADPAGPAPAAAPALPAAPPPALAEPSEPAAPGGRPPPGLQAQVAEAARAGLEAVRAEWTARCVPPGPAARGAPFTFHLTFDGSGREIARGIGEDRRRRAPEVAACLRRLPLGGLKVPAPGTTVGVRVALTLP